jgi:hypothetical protein
MDGAYFIYGHTQLGRSLGIGYQSAWAKSYLPTRRARNAFYTAAGKLLPPGPAGKRRLSAVQPEMEPAQILAVLQK